MTIASNGVPVTSLGGVQVSLAGSPIPIFFVSPTQINAVAPFTLTARQTLQLTVQNNGVPSVPYPLTVVAAIPGIFTTAQTGSGQGSIVGVSTGVVANSAAPVNTGDFISIYCAGLGPVNQSVDISAPAPSQAPLPMITGQVSVIIGNSSAEVSYAGLAPGFYGLYQINAKVPASAPTGSAVPLQISVNNVPSNQVTLAIQ